MTLIDFTLSNARRFYSSMGNPLAVKGLEDSEPSEPLISSESEESSLASLQIKYLRTSKSFDQPSESEFVAIDTHISPRMSGELSRTDMRRHS